MFEQRIDFKYKYIYAISHKLSKLTLLPLNLKIFLQETTRKNPKIWGPRSSLCHPAVETS